MSVLGRFTLVEKSALPQRLRSIYEATQRLEMGDSNLDHLREMWRAYIAQARQSISGINVEADGENIYLGALSPGCRTCKDGTWDCVFTTIQCNLNCGFCINPHTIPQDYAGSAFGATPAQIMDNYAQAHIIGVSFSGGEPFLDTEKLFEWAAEFKSRYPNCYYWVYTNGLLASEQNLRRLGEIGIEEIRFNMAATGYNHPTVLQNVATAARFIPHVTVEIPAIPEHAPQVFESLSDWCAAGVQFLNLHELMCEQGTNAATMKGPRLDVALEDGHSTIINPESRKLTLAVMEKVQNENLPLSVNDCSLQSKIRQLRGRRRNLAGLTKAPYEKLNGMFYESCCAYLGEECHFFHPDSVREMRRQYPDHQLVRIIRTAPLSIYDSGRWIVFENL